MEIKLLSPQVWRSLVDLVAVSLSTPAHQNLLRTLLAAAHNRHIGLTPALAVGLTRLLLPVQAAYQPPWDKVMNRLTETITELSGMSSVALAQRAFSASMMPSASLRFSVYEFAFPLVLAAARQINQNVLFSEDDDLRDSVTPTQYQKYSDDLADALSKLAVDTSGRGVPSSFWKSRALTLISLTRERVTTDVNPHPVTFLPDARLLLDLQPETSYKQDDLRKRLQLSPRRVLTDPRQHEAGASTVKLTRGIEDLHRMIKSELIYPEPILTDRLVNTGYWSIQPPPKPIQLRQLLLVAVCPPAISQSPLASFVKACWMHFLTRFCHLMQQNDLVKSEIRWIEGDRFAQARALAFILRDLPSISAHYPDAAEPRYLYQFLNACGWFPTYIDQHARHKSVSGWQTPFTEFTPSQLMDWTLAAWNGQQELTRWSASVKRRVVLPTGTAPRTDTFAPTKLQTDQYIHVHLLLFLPSTLSPNAENAAEEMDWGTAPRWRSRFRGVKSLTTLYVPERFGEPGWELMGDPMPDHSRLRSAHELEPRKVAGLLIDEWFEHIAKGMGRA